MLLQSVDLKRLSSGKMTAQPPLMTMMWFGSFFGGFGGFGRFGRDEEEENQIQKGETVYVELEVSLKDLYVGREIKVSMGMFLCLSQCLCGLRREWI